MEQFTNLLHALFFVGTAIVVLVIACVVLIRSGTLARIVPRLAIAKQNAAGPVYRLEVALLSATEREFLTALERTPLDGVAVCPKVRVADVIAVRSSPVGRRADFYQHFNAIAQKHFDFVLIRRSDARPLVAIELDDKSHRQADRVARDKLLDRAASEAGLPLIRFSAAASYSAITIHTHLAGPLRMSAMSQPPSNPSPLTTTSPELRS